MTEVVELYVVMHCEACEASVRRAIRKIPGVESYKIDFYGQKVTVIGNVDREDVWRRIHKTGKRVMLIPEPAPPPKKEEKKSESKKEESKKEEKKEETKDEKKEGGKTEEKNVEDVKVHEKRDEVETVLDVKASKKEDSQGEEKTEGKEDAGKKENAEEAEWVPMFVSAPFYTLPTQIILTN